MPDLTYVVYDNATFFTDERIPLLKKDTPPRFLALTDITTPILKNTDDIITNKNLITGLDSEVQALQTKDAVYKTQIEDNTARINNLEDEDLKSKFLSAIELAAIRKNFVNATRVEIEYGRKEIISVKVMQILVNTPTERKERNITSGSLIEEITTVINGVTTRKVILDFGNTPITGYAIIL